MERLSLLLIISDSKYEYGKLLVERLKVENSDVKIVADAVLLLKSLNIGDSCAKRIMNTKRIKLDNVFVNYLVRELYISKFYRECFLRNWTSNANGHLMVILKPTKYDLIDYNWNERVYIMVRERCELDHALSWLSTFGGAFSALGDYFENCAETAGKISVHQLKLAIRLGDPNIAARCRLYLSLSLIQKKRFKLARRLITTEYNLAKSAVIVDVRLLNMCRGIWSKLQYEHQLYKKTRRGSLCTRIKNVIL